jgi:hypothetical protein
MQDMKSYVNVIKMCAASTISNIYNVYFKHQYGFRNNIWIAPIFSAEQEIPVKTAEGRKKRKEKKL